jgi:carboxypeptidase PM20D1
LRRAFLALLLAALGVAGLVVVRAWRFRAEPRAAAPAADRDVDAGAAADHLAAAIRFRTVSREDAPVEAEAFAGLRRWLEATYPAVHRVLSRELVADHTLLYTWSGTDPALPPVLVMGHQDVVPVENESDWTHPPFEGRIAEGCVWGRGALDDKGSVIALLEAVERLAAGGFLPRRTIYLAFGHDEETGGRGATVVAGLLAGRGVRLESTLDEGQVVARGLVPGVAVPVALVGVAEKGYVNVELEVAGEGGHSSMPPAETVIGILSAAVRRVEEHPLPARPQSMWRLLDVVGREMPFPQRLAVANRWLFAPILERMLARTPAGNAGLRTTTAATIIQGGVKSNVLPARARAVVNFRVIPGDTVPGVLEHVRRVVDDPRVSIRDAGSREASRASRSDGAAWSRVQSAVRRAFPDAVVAPALVLGGTDSRHFQETSLPLRALSRGTGRPAPHPREGRAGGGGRPGARDCVLPGIPARDGTRGRAPAAVTARAQRRHGNVRRDL